ncbi:hypothetical protein HDU76_007814 [Blyttiomyces sp. JEL0837]|nr:hypothetical protein HDU76_007814 [Blyttiomyces sp. JEL0837]
MVEDSAAKLINVRRCYPLSWFVPEAPVLKSVGVTSPMGELSYKVYTPKYWNFNDKSGIQIELHLNDAAETTSRVMSIECVLMQRVRHRDAPINGLPVSVDHIPATIASNVGTVLKMKAPPQSLTSTTLKSEFYLPNTAIQPDAELDPFMVEHIIQFTVVISRLMSSKRATFLVPIRMILGTDFDDRVLTSLPIPVNWFSKHSAGALTSSHSVGSNGSIGNNMNQVTSSTISGMSNGSGGSSSNVGTATSRRSANAKKIGVNDLAPLLSLGVAGPSNGGGGSGGNTPQSASKRSATVTSQNSSSSVKSPSTPMSAGAFQQQQGRRPSTSSHGSGGSYDKQKSNPVQIGDIASAMDSMLIGGGGGGSTASRSNTGRESSRGGGQRTGTPSVFSSSDGGSVIMSPTNSYLGNSSTSSLSQQHQQQQQQQQPLQPPPAPSQTLQQQPQLSRETLMTSNSLANASYASNSEYFTNNPPSPASVASVLFPSGTPPPVHLPQQYQTSPTNNTMWAPSSTSPFATQPVHHNQYQLPPHPPQPLQRNLLNNSNTTTTLSNNNINTNFAPIHQSPPPPPPSVYNPTQQLQQQQLQPPPPPQVSSQPPLGPLPPVPAPLTNTTNSVPMLKPPPTTPLPLPPTSTSPPPPITTSQSTTTATNILDLNSPPPNHLPPPPPPPPAIEETPAPPALVFKVQFAFTPTLPDELALNLGELVEVLEAFDDGWGRGAVNRNGGREMGYFPIRCLTLPTAGVGMGAEVGSGLASADVKEGIGAV